MASSKKVDYLSSTPTSTATPASTSQPDSLDLDYDMWQGQFEFVGPTVPAATLDQSTAIAISSSLLHPNLYNLQQSRTASSSLEDLRLNDYIPPDQPVLIDEETFLSLHPNDFPPSGPHSGFYLDEYNNHGETQQLNNNNSLITSNKDSNANNILNNKLLNNKTNNLISSVIIEEKNAKNNLINSNLKLISDNPEFGNKYILKATNGTNKMNGLIKTDLCDNLNEQVSTECGWGVGRGRGESCWSRCRHVFTIVRMLLGLF